MTRADDTVEGARLRFLDGLRCLAVLSVMAYHSGVAGFRVGGFFGVDVFFVLSGYLITTLLMADVHRTGSIALRVFWGRRASRLLPALIVMLVAVEIYVSWFAPAGRFPGFRADAISVALYVSNWHFIAEASNYFARTASPSPLTHTWSLAIEEQFYLVWPLVVLGLVALARKWRISARLVVAAASSAGAVASTAWMAGLYRAGASDSRLYYGTDTHAQCLLVGCALAAGMGTIAARTKRLLDRHPGLADLIGAGAAGGILAMMGRVGSASAFTYEGGFLCLAGLVAIVLTAVVNVPDGRMARALSWAPAAFVGRISYGMYLWYFPLFEVIDRSSVGVTGTPLFAVRTVADLAIATVSFYAIEIPIRRYLRSSRTPQRPRASVVRPAGAWALGIVAAVALLGISSPTARALSIALPSTPPGGASRAPVRILITGDSTALTLGLGLGDTALDRAYGVVIDDDGLLGCGLVVSYRVLEQGVSTPPAAPCLTSTPAAGQWPAKLREAVATFRPQVVVIVAGRWEVQTYRTSPTGPWLDITRPAAAAVIAGQLDEAISTASSDGARVAVATSPCFSSGEQPDGKGWPEDSPVRLNAYNSLVRQAVARYSEVASILDLNGLVCPAGRFAETLGGVTVRAPDGVHYPFFSIHDPNAEDPDTAAQTVTFGRWIGARILPSLIHLAS